jgi:hypothetical protein
MKNTIYIHSGYSGFEKGQGKVLMKNMVQRKVCAGIA